MKKEKLIDLVCKKFNLGQKEAAGLILRGDVLLDDKPVTKAGILADPSSEIRIRNKSRYVSRGAYKLLTAFNNFDISVKDKICLDVGSSTGGFTQVLLEMGAKKVYAVDCGKNLLHYSLRNDNRVISFENKKYSDITLSDFNSKIDFAVSDLSFASSVKLAVFLHDHLGINEMVILIKPQFEYERLREKLSLGEKFKGVVTDDIERQKITLEVMNELKSAGFNVVSFIQSGIRGTKGNIEYLFHLKVYPDF